MTVHITEKIIINKPIHEVFTTLLDYDAFLAWNPWHKFDTEMNVTMHTPTIGVGSGYAWESKIVGTGNITTVAVRENEEIEQDLEFYKPMKSKAKTYLVTKKIDDNSTEVSWKMTTHMPFFAIFFLNT